MQTIGGSSRWCSDAIRLLNSLEARVPERGEGRKEEHDAVWNCCFFVWDTLATSLESIG